jgi:hypothetical protein
MPSDDHHHIKEVEADHGAALPQMQLAVGEKDYAADDRGDKEANIPDECSSADSELAYQGHGSGNDGTDKTGGSYQLANRHAAAVGVHGGEGAEDVRGAIAKGQEGHSCQALAQAENFRNRTQIDAEEVAGGDPYRREQQTKPDHQDGERDWLHAA